MLEGSKITGHTTSNYSSPSDYGADGSYGVVYIYETNTTFAVFEMRGGIITGNTSTGTSSGGVYTRGSVGSGRFRMYGGSITGNSPRDVYIDATNPQSWAEKTSGTIGVATPSELATQPTYP